MGRYQKYHSNYTLRKRHQTVKGGVITERDWTTLGERLRFGPNKRAMYADGNFIFTSSNVAPSPNRKKNYTTTNVYTYNDVEYSTDDVNTVAPNINTNDIRTFAYFGSCVELVRASVEAIVAEFPACITLSTQQLTYYDADKDEFYPIPIVGGGSGEGYYLLSNPFGIDLNHDDVTLGKYDNPYRFLSASYTDYTINDKPITNYTISEWLCRDEETGEILDDCNCQYDRHLAPVLRIDITTEDDSVYILYGYLVDNDICYTYKDDGNGFVLKPNDDVIEDYFNGLKGFERQLLNRKTTPLYKNSFITPIMGELNYQYVERTYTWPLMSGSDYCIDITSMSYTNFINSLVDLATTMDELWTDNLYERMTHEAIKNFDWTYTREYAEGEEEDNVDGGERMKKILHIFARLMDDCKRYADAIQYANKVSYCSYDDMPNAVLSDKLGYQGWDVVSTIPTITNEKGKVIDLSNVTIDESTIGNWFPTVNPKEVTPSYVDIDFSRRLLLSSAHIWRTKGTKHSIEMVMGMFGFKIDKDYTLTEQYYIVKPKAYISKIYVTIPADSDDSTSKEKKIEYEFGDTLVAVNQHKGISRSSEDEFSGIPVKQLDFIEKDDNGNNKKDDDGNYIYDSYIIPYFDQSKYDDNEPYDGYLYFQQKGGWGKTLANGEEIWDLEKAEAYEKWKNSDSDSDYYPEELNSHIGYKETISYLHVVSRVNDLLNVNSRTVKGGDIYYVVNLDDFMDYYEVTKDDGGNSDGGFDCNYVTHFFMFRYTAYDASVFTSWMNVSLTVGENEYDSNIAKKVEYLDGLMTTTFGNNPHSGYGNYDCGVEFLEYLKKPFKYALDNYTITGTDENGVLYSERGESATFDIKGPLYTRGKFDKIEKLTWEDKKDNEYINSKVLIMDNLVKGEKNDCNALTLYTDYFFNVMLPYVMQVIPSTTILILRGFDCSCNLSITEFHYGDSGNKNTVDSIGGTLTPSLTYELNGETRTDGNVTYEIIDGADYASIDKDNGALAVIENTASTERVITVMVTIAYDGGGECEQPISATKTVEIIQNGKESTIEYDAPMVELSYANVPNDGGTSDPKLSYSQTWRINDVEQTPITSGGTVKYELVENLNSRLFSVSVDETTGVVTASPTLVSHDAEVDVCIVKATVTLNDVSGEGTATVLSDPKDPEPEPTTEYSLEATLQYNDGNNIPYQGGRYGGEVTAYLITKVDGTETNREKVTPNSTFFTMEPTEWAKLENEGTGFINWDENPDSKSRNLVVSVNVYYTAPDGTELEAVTGGEIFQDGQEPEIKYELEVTDFAYPSQSYNYMAHENIDVSSLTVMFNTYQNKVLVDSTNVTDSCTLEITPNVDWITRPLVSLKNSTIINISENTTTEQREGTVHLVATYGEYTAEADSNTILQGPKPDEYSYALNVANFQYHTSAGTNVIPADGCTNVSPDLAVLLMTTNTSTGYTTGTLVTPTSSYYKITNSGSIDSSTGAITISSNIATTAKTYTVTGEFKYTAPNGEELEASESVTLTQPAPEVTYSLEISSFSYNGGNNIPAEGGPFYPELVVSLNTTQGAKSSTSHVTPDSTFYTMEATEWAKLENDVTGLINWDENPDSGSRNLVVSVNVYYTAPDGTELEAVTGGEIFQDGQEPTTEYSLEATLQYNGGNNIPYQGKEYSGEVTAYLITKVDGTETNREKVTPDSTLYTMEATEWAKLENDVTGLINWDENTDSTRSVVVVVAVYYTAPDGALLYTTAEATVQQDYDDSPNTKVTYELSPGTLTLNYDGSDVPQNNLLLQLVHVSMSIGNSEGEYTDTITYSTIDNDDGKSELYHPASGYSNIMVATNTGRTEIYGMDLPRVAYILECAVAFEDETLVLDNKTITYNFKWHWGDGKVFERSGTMNPINQGMGDACEWTSDVQTSAMVQIENSYTMYPEVVVTITD